MIAEGLSCVSVSPYRRLSQTNCSLLCGARESFLNFQYNTVQHGAVKFFQKAVSLFKNQQKAVTILDNMIPYYTMQYGTILLAQGALHER
jgi:hypothetical protein